MDYIFSEEEFQDLVFKSEKPFNKDFLKKWNNIECVVCFAYVLTPVEWAVSSDYLDVVKFLVENGADITLDNNYTICAAIFNCNINVVKYLLSTNIYFEYDLQADDADDPDIKELLINYTQFQILKCVVKM